jgi:mono/diheme cytochrome c family protein
MLRWHARLGLALLFATVLPGAALAQDPAVTFRQNCSSCHTIGGGRLTGPDLKDVTARRDRAWLVRFIQDARAVIDSGDPYAAQLVQEARGVVMPTIAGMTPAVAENLIDLIVAESKRSPSQFAGAVLLRPLTANDIVVGRNLFVGTLSQSSRGPACVSCHTVGTLGGLQGGRLGPDLTLAVERLQGTKGLTAWLSAPATPTMQSVYGKAPLQPEEILAVVAFLEGTAKGGVPASPVALLNFLLLGLGGTVLGLVVFDAAWKWRFRGVRRSLVHGREPGGQQ